jgi:hypothetical protein
MRNWNWMVIVAAGGLAFACGGDDSPSGTSGAGGSGGGGTVGNTSRTTNNTNATSTSGGNTTNNTSSDTSSDTSSTTGSGGTTSDTSSTTGAGGAAGETSTTGMGGEAGGMGEGGMAGAPPTAQELLCQDSCDNQAQANCDGWTEEGCLTSCMTMYDSLGGNCDDEFAAVQECDANTPPATYLCSGGFASTLSCGEEFTAMTVCGAG